jgi:tetratricopeptide (TPR) repeat protein
VVWAVVILTGVAYRDELRWAADELPRYLEGRIGSPGERKLYRKAKRIIESGGDLNLAREMLQRSIDIDPTSEAVYWMGRCHLSADRDDEALVQFLRYIELDPTKTEAYVRAAAIRAGRGDPAGARAVLEQGVDYFSSHEERFVPRPDPEVGMKYNNKAIDVYRFYGKSIARLRRKIEALDTVDPSTADD